jgi:hypothetical protein
MPRTSGITRVTHKCWMMDAIREYDDGYDNDSIKYLSQDYQNYVSLGLTHQNMMREFLMYESHIKNDYLFWTLFGKVYVICPNTYYFREQITDAIRRGTRLELPLLERIICTNSLIIFMIVSAANEDRKEEKKEGLDFAEMLGTHCHELHESIKKSTAQNDIEIYRGFLVPEDADVRVGRKMDNSSSHIQDEGLGFSFTYDKEVAIHHSVKNSSTALLLEIYGKDLVGDLSEFKTWREFYTAFQQMDLSEEMIDKTIKLSEIEKMNASWEDREVFKDYIGFNVKPCVASYSIKESDIVTSLNYMGQEREIFCLPENATLMHYEFTSWKKQIEYKDKEKFEKGHLQFMLTPEYTKLIDLGDEQIDERKEKLNEIIKNQEDYFAQFSNLDRKKNMKSLGNKKRKKGGKKFGKNKKKKK